MSIRQARLMAAWSMVAVVLIGGCSHSTSEQSEQARSSSSGSPEAPAVEQISVTEAARRRDQGVRIIDVREPGEYAAVHVPGAELVPLATVTQAAAGWDKSEPIVLICRSGNRSNIAARKLQDLGFSAVANVQGGMNAWRGATMTGSERGSR